MGIPQSKIKDFCPFDKGAFMPVGISRYNLLKGNAESNIVPRDCHASLRTGSQ